MSAVEGLARLTLCIAILGAAFAADVRLGVCSLIVSLTTLAVTHALLRAKSGGTDE